MNVDQLSEMEEYIDSEIREATGRGFRIRAESPPSSKWCALAAVAFSRHIGNWTDASVALGMDQDESVSFAWGFDGNQPGENVVPDLFAMGARFRERVIAGEYKR